MAGSTRSGGPAGAIAARASCIAAVARLFVACSGDNGVPHVSVPDTHVAQAPPANPQEALLNGEIPLGNAEQPPGNSEQPPTNLEQPSSNPGSAVATVVNQCTAFCASVATVCSGACSNGCSGVSQISSACLTAFSAFLNCATAGLVACDGEGRLEVPNGGACFEEATAVLNCIDDAATVDRNAMTSGDNQNPSR
jgi:hypothetical protein